MIVLRPYARDELGQSMVELALALPVLLMIVIGIIDVGRIYASAVAASSAAKQAASFGARHPQATLNDICQRARDELAAGSVSNPCTTPPVTVECVRDAATCGSLTGVLAQPGAGAELSVTVTYQIDLVGGSLVNRLFRVNPVLVSGQATLIGMSQ